MSFENRKRPSRIPLNNEELARIIAFKQKKAKQKLLQFKASLLYKTLNIFNIICFFTYWELVFCYFGPCLYQTEKVSFVNAKYEQLRDINNKPYVIEVKLKSKLNYEYHVLVHDYLKIPKRKLSEIKVGYDFLLHKKLKAKFLFSNYGYRLSEANPVLFVSGLLIFILLSGFYHNLNENPYSLRGITVLNLLSILSLLFF